MKTKIILQILFTTNPGIQVLGWSTLLIFGIAANWVEWCEIPMFAAVAVLFLHIIYLLICMLIDWIKSW